LLSGCHLGHRDRTAEHEQGEAQAASLGIPYPEPTRTLYITIDGIAYEIAAAIMSWRVIPDNGHYPVRLPLQSGLGAFVGLVGQLDLNLIFG